jgi:hypothetical protein
MIWLIELNRGNYGYTDVRISVSLLDQMVYRPIRGNRS